MTPQNIICGKEHNQIFCIESGNTYDILDRHREWLAVSQKNYGSAKTLGLHQKGDGLAPGNFIGMVWIGEGENKTVLRVDSKFPTMNYIKMFAECVADSCVGKHTNCLDFWADEDLINVENDNDFLLLTAIAFLRELNTLCTRHLRRHFMRERQNFVGKVKGKILIGENLRQNIIRQRPDRVFCEYQSVSNDILENRILRTALEKAARCIAKYAKNKKYNLSNPQEWIRACRAHLNGVSTAHIKQRDFVAVRTRGVFAPYKRPLHLAKAVLRQFGFNPQQDIKQTQTPPFALNSAELFERYAELQLRKQYRSLMVLRGRNIKGGEKSDDSFRVSVRPDFYIIDEDNKHLQIIDAKYKDIKDFYNDNGKPAREDIYQVIAYSQHQGLLKELLKIMNLNNEPEINKPEIKLSLVYPSLDTKEIEEWKTTTAFASELHVCKIPCPTKSNAD